MSVIGICELVWLKHLLIELKFCELRSMRLVCDNQMALHIAFSLAFHEISLKLAVILFRRRLIQEK